jgi:hypothetical protein
MNPNNFHSVRSLISLKRHEQPDDAYFDELLEEFHRRQKQHHLNPSFHREMIERTSEWFANTSRWNYVMGAGAAYALVFFSVIFFWPNNERVLNSANTMETGYAKPSSIEAVSPEAATTEDEEDKSEQGLLPTQ